MRKGLLCLAVALLGCLLAVGALADTVVIDNQNAAGGNKRLNLRTEPDTKSGTLGMLYDGAQAERLGETGEWSQISFGGQTGYVLTQYLITPEEAQAKGLAEGGAAKADVPLPMETLTLYSAPGSDADKAVAELPSGTELRILAFLDPWVYVKTQSEPVVEGYANSLYVCEAGAQQYVYVCAADPDKLASLRANPTETSKVVGSYYNGVQGVRLFSFQRDGWVRMRIGTVEGWMAAQDVADAPADRRELPYYPPIASISARRTELRAANSNSSDELLVCEAGESVEVLGKSEGGNWLHVRVYDGNPYGLTGLTGYVKAASVGRLESNSDGLYGVYAVVASTGEHTNLEPIFAEADASSEELGLYYQGVEVELLDLTLTAFAHVRAGGLEGYMQKTDITLRRGSVQEGDASTLPQAQVNAPNGITMRAQPEADALVTAAIEDGQTVSVLGVLGAWCCVRFDEKTGFVPRAQLTGDLAGYARTTEPQLALRVSPSTGANVIVRIPQGRRVLIVETDGQWKYVEYEGQFGYVMENYLDPVY